jgi:hypothetical protein
MFIDIFMGIFTILHMLFSFLFIFVLQNLSHLHIEVAFTTQMRRKRGEKAGSLSLLPRDE